MNSFGNAILFLMSNQRAKRYFKRFLRTDVDNRVRATNLQKETKIVKVASASIGDANKSVNISSELTNK